MNDKEQFYRQIVLQKCVSPDFKELTHFLFFWKKEIIRLLWKLESLALPGEAGVCTLAGERGA